MQGGHLNVPASDSKTNAAGGSNGKKAGGTKNKQGGGAKKDKAGGTKNKQGGGAKRDKAGGTKKDKASAPLSGAAVANDADVFSGFGGDEGPAWDCLLLTKQEALAKISGKPQGSFVIRPSDKAYAAMSMVKPDGSQCNQHIEERFALQSRRGMNQASARNQANKKNSKPRTRKPDHEQPCPWSRRCH